MILTPTVSLNYAKRFLHPGEEQWFSRGDRPCVVDVRGVRVGMAICADTNHAAHASEAADQGASIYAASVFFTERGYSADTERVQRYAAKHAMVVIMANYGAPTGGVESAGRSAIGDDSGSLLAEASCTGQALVVAARERGGWSGRTVQA